MKKLSNKKIYFKQKLTSFDLAGNKFNRGDTVINLVENKIGCIVEIIGCEYEGKLEVIREELVQEVTYYYPIYLVVTSEGNLESWRETDID